ncbi:MAG: flagellar motor switch protein FliN [Rugosibacter sp.]|nr:MAG: flagellar motor switch protein FliN [Rugosibacter sp.]
METPANKDDWTAMNSQTGADTLPHADAVQPAQIFEQFSGEDRTTSEPQGFDMIMDIPVALTVELGRTKIPIRNLLQLAHGSIVELDGLAGEPMDILINGTLIAQGEVVVVNEKFGIRLTDIITPQERIRKLNR